MNERWITFGGAMLALVFATGLLFPRFRPAPPPGSNPTSQDAGEQGLLGAYRWLQGSGIGVMRLRTRYDQLAGLSHAPSGNLLVVTEPQKFPVRRAEGEALAAWVEKGNSVLVLRADGARPEWTQGRFSQGLLPVLGIRVVSAGKKRAPICKAAQPDKPDDEDAPKAGEIPKDGRIRLLPSPSDSIYPLLAGVRALEVKPTAAARQVPYLTELGYSEDDGRIDFVWLCDTARQRTALWQFRRGQGNIWVSSYAELFSNGTLARADNARLLSNLVALATAGGGAVIFDDMHQGDSVLYDPAALFNDPRLHASLGLLLAIWLVYLLGTSNRFATPGAKPRAVTPAAFAAAVGGFYARSINSWDAAQDLITRFHAEARRRLKRPGSGPAWELLERTPAVERTLLQALRAEQAQLDALRERPEKYPRDLRRLAALIHQLRESLR